MNVQPDISAPPCAAFPEGEAAILADALRISGRALASGGPERQRGLRWLDSVLFDGLRRRDALQLAEGMAHLAAGRLIEACQTWGGLLALGRCQDAVAPRLKERLADFLALDPAALPAAVRALLAELCYQAGQPEQGRGLLCGLDENAWKALGPLPQLAELCLHLMNNGHLAEGRALLSGLARCDQGHAPSQLRLAQGELAWEAGMRPLARVHFRAAADHGGEPDPYALFRLVRGLMASGRGGLGRDVLRRVRPLAQPVAPANLSLALSVADGLCALGQPAEARALLGEVDPSWLADPVLEQWAMGLCPRAGAWPLARLLLERRQASGRPLGHGGLNLLWHMHLADSRRDAFLEAVRREDPALGGPLALFWQGETLALAGRFGEAAPLLREAMQGGVMLMGRAPLLLGTALACSGHAEEGSDILLAAQRTHFSSGLRVVWAWAAGFEAALTLLGLGRRDEAQEALAQSAASCALPGDPCRALLAWLQGGTPAGFSRACLRQAEACAGAVHAGHLGRAWLLLLAAVSAPRPEKALALLAHCHGLEGAPASLDPEALARTFYPRDPAHSPRRTVVARLASGERL